MAQSGNKKLDSKGSVRVATVNSIPNLESVDINSIDGVTLSQGNRILVKDKASRDGIELATSKRNGIYEVIKVVNGFVELVRSQDANRDKEVTAGMFTFVEEGFINEDTGWLLITDNPIVLDTTGLKFIKFTGAGEISANIQAAIDRNSDNIVLNAFRIATQNSLTVSNMVDGFVDEYEDEDGVDNAASINEIYDAIDDLYKTEAIDVQLLLNLNGADGQTSTVDSSSFGHSVTLIGNAQLDTAIKKFGSASLKLDGSGDYARLADSSSWDVFASNSDTWTIDFHIQFSSLSNNNQTFLCHFEQVSPEKRWLIQRLNDGRIDLQVNDSPAAKFLRLIPSSGTGQINDTTTLHHVAIIKIADEYGMYIDGTQVAYTQDSNTFDFTGVLLVSGDRQPTPSAASFVAGNMDSIRITKNNVLGGSPNVGKTDTITVPTSETSSSIVNTTLISEAVTAQVQADDARVVIFEQDVDAVTLNTDLKAFVSRDDGVTYSEVTLVNEGEYETGRNILAGSVDISSQPAGTSMRYKIETANLRSLKLHGTGLSWA